MKIEKINDYQIRCTLTKEDLARRGLKVSELAYGTDAARDLFREMMEQAGDDLGFMTEDYPIMVEAIPINSDCIVLIITKADDPEELDTRFANFAPSVLFDEDAGFDGDDDEDFDDDDFAGLFERIREGGMDNLFESDFKGARKLKKRSAPGKKTTYADDAEYRIFSFPLLMDVVNLAKRVDTAYDGMNTLYKSPSNGAYYLLLHRHTEEDDPVFTQLCLMLSEYGKEVLSSAASEQVLDEHDSVIIRDRALQQLAGR